MSKKYEWDFAWGDTRGIREIMMKHAEFLREATMPWDGFGYPPHGGNGLLVQAIKELIRDLTGKKYEHVLVTVGATHAINTAIAAIRTDQTKFMYTNRLFFSRYPGIAVNSGLKHIKTDKIDPKLGDIGIIDSPSNPMGILSAAGSLTNNVIWDAAYYTPTYCGVGHLDRLKCHPIKPLHKVMVGSLNKLTGLNGLRIGWLATDDYFIYEKALAYLTSNVCGISQPSQFAALQILSKVDLDEFYMESKAMLDSNKTEMSRLDHIFSYQPIPGHGMFYLVEVDSKIKALLDRAGVSVQDGSMSGDTRDSVRFNLGNSTQMTKAMVDAVLKVDRK